MKARELLALPWTNINAQYANGNTPLILAVQGASQLFCNLVTQPLIMTQHIFLLAGNNDQLVSMLLDHPQLSVNLRGLDGYTALIR